MGEGVEHIRDRDDARVDRDSFPGELRRVAFAVPPFVMMARYFLCHPELWDVAFGEELRADDGVGRDEMALGFFELSFAGPVDPEVVLFFTILGISAGFVANEKERNARTRPA